jgi:hypothetical protein
MSLFVISFSSLFLLIFFIPRFLENVPSTRIIQNQMIGSVGQSEIDVRVEVRSHATSLHWTAKDNDTDNENVLVIRLCADI